MNCQDIARVLDEQEVDSLLAREQSDVQAHLVSCRDCSRDWQIHAQLSAARIPAVPAEMRALYSPRAGEIFSTGARWRGRLVVIGTLVVVAAAAAMLVLQIRNSPVPVSEMADSAPTKPSAIPPLLMQALSETVRSPAVPTPEAESKPAEEWTLSVTEWLAIRDDPDALIAAATLMMTSKRDAQRIGLLLQRATAMASESARIQATAMLLCQAIRPCDATPYEQALRRVAPENALGWAGEVFRASQADDPEAFRNALAAMSRATTFDLYLNANILSVTSQVRAALIAPPLNNGANPSVSREMIALEAVAAMPIPAYQPITKFCKSVTDDRTLLECRQIGAAMRAGDTVLTNLIGVTISSSGLSAESAEARSLARERNMIQWISIKSQAFFSEDDPESFLRAVAEHPREIDALRATLEAHGMSSVPPADWKLKD